MKVHKVLTRIFIRPEDLERVIAFYEEVFSERCQLRFRYSKAGLELASVGSVLLIAGSEDALLPFKSTQVTFLVDSIEIFRDVLKERGAVILEEPRNVPTGVNMRVKHPDGIIVEYVQFT